jgi:hypothetical protein
VPARPPARNATDLKTNTMFVSGSATGLKTKAGSARRLIFYSFKSEVLPAQ